MQKDQQAFQKEMQQMTNEHDLKMLELKIKLEEMKKLASQTKFQAYNSPPMNQFCNDNSMKTPGNDNYRGPQYNDYRGDDNYRGPQYNDYRGENNYRGPQYNDYRCPQYNDYRCNDNYRGPRYNDYRGENNYRGPQYNDYRGENNYRGPQYNDYRGENNYRGPQYNDNRGENNYRGPQYNDYRGDNNYRGPQQIYSNQSMMSPAPLNERDIQSTNNYIKKEKMNNGRMIIDSPRPNNSEVPPS